MTYHTGFGRYAVILTPVITRIFNTSLKSGKIPNAWKRADVIPVQKKTQLIHVPN